MIIAASLLLVLAHSSLQHFPGATPDEADYRHLYPLVALAFHVHHPQYAQQILPYALGRLENLRYPKDRLHIDFFVEVEENDSAPSSLEAINRQVLLL